MPRHFEGNTLLGRALNRIASMSEESAVQEQKEYFGIIIKMIGEEQNNPQYVAEEVLLLESSGGEYVPTKKIARNVRLLSPAGVIAETIGRPTDCKGMTCRIKYLNESRQYGTAEIITDVIYDEEEVELSNTQEIQGKSYCVPGSGGVFS